MEIYNRNLKLNRRSTTSREYQKSMQVIDPNFKNGLGCRYFQVLSSTVDKIHQLDTVTGATLSNGTVKGRAIQLALALQAKGIAPNDIILLNSRSSADESIIILACLFIGATMALLDMNSTFSDSARILGKLKPKICFCEIRAASQMDRVFMTLGLQREIIIMGNEPIANKTLLSSLFYIKESPDFEPYCVEDPFRSIAFIVPTQGTSNPVKLVCLSHATMMYRTNIMNEVVGHTVKLMSYYSLPYNSQITIICSSFEYNVTRIIPGPFSERSCCKLIQELQVDLLMMCTNDTRELFRHIAIKDFNISSLKVLYVGATMTTKEDMRYFRLTLPKVQIVEVYSSQETGIVAAVRPEDYKLLNQKSTSCGTVYPGQKVKIVDISTGAPVADDTLGHILFAGGSLMLGYYKSSKTNYMEKHYFKTEDIGMIDSDGWLYIEGRLIDVITSTVLINQRSTTRDVEIIIGGHPLISECVVVVKDNQIIACIRTRPNVHLTIERIKRFVDSRLVFSYRPSKYVFYDDFPRTPTGKIRRYVIMQDVFARNLSIVSSLADLQNIV